MPQNVWKPPKDRGGMHINTQLLHFKTFSMVNTILPSDQSVVSFTI